VASQDLPRGERLKTPRPSATSPELTQKVISNYGNHCALCNADGAIVPLEIAALRSFSEGGRLSEDNLTLLCPNCHENFDRQPREVEFIQFLAWLLRKNPRFSDELTEAKIGRDVRFRADLLATRTIDGTTEKLLIECKRSPETVGRLGDAIAQMLRYREAYGPSTLILAIPATLQSAESVQIAAAGIELWDLDYLASTFRDEILSAPVSYYKLLLQARIGRGLNKSVEQLLLEKLKAVDPGRNEWSVYQSLIGEILEHLFCPTLVKPISELSDASRANRRDFILPNYSETGFWSYLRSQYAADYIVVDAKNYTGKLNKSQVLQIANYLKTHGAGRFGMIFSRKGGDGGGCLVTLREQWAIHQKMILIFSDDDVERMLLAKSDGRTPEEVIGSQIEAFRLSL
jgi:hypothetical protein